MSKNKPSYKVEYSSEDQEWNAFERGFWGVEKDKKHILSN